MKQQPFEINGCQVAPGSRGIVELPLGGMYTHTPVTMPVQVVHGRKPGPVVFVSAAIHGDEINGVEVIRRLLRLSGLKQLSGTLVAVPIVNVFGFHNRSRYLPDRRDLNRSLPGSEHGSLASRLGHVFFREIVHRCDLGIDLHTAAIHRDNLPQIRADLDDPVLRPLAEAFGAPVLLHSDLLDGSLRNAAAAQGISVMVYEAGEALRFDELAIRIGLRGVINVLRRLAMLPQKRRTTPPRRYPAVLRASTWIRAPHAGILRSLVPLGAVVSRDSVLGLIADPFGEGETAVITPGDGVVIGRTNLPLVYEGEALFHVGRTKRAGAVGEHVEAVHAKVEQMAPGQEEEPPIV